MFRHWQGRLGRQSHADDRSQAELAADRQGSAMRFDEALADRQAEASTAIFPRDHGFRLAEGLQRALLLLSRHPDPAILDFDDSATAARRGETNHHRAAVL